MIIKCYVNILKVRNKMKKNKIKGYKVFNPNWTCKDYQYKVGGEYKMDDDIKICQRGFHFCEKLIDCFDYYPFDSNNKVAEIEALGKVLKEENGNNISFCYDDRCLDSQYIEEQLRNGNWMLQRPEETDSAGNKSWKSIHYSSIGNIEDSLDTSDDAAISAEYEQKVAYFQHKDKELELHLQQIQTSHNAIQTEIDSVKKVIQKNIESTFKTFES